MGGTFLRAGTQRVKVAALLSPPAGVPGPAGLLRQLAAAAGVQAPPFSGKLPSLERLSVGEPAQGEGVPAAAEGKLLVGVREAMHHGDGALTGSAGWQRQLRPLPELRISPADAAGLGVTDLAEVEVETESGRASMRARVDKGMPAGTLGASEAYPETRRLMPYVIDSQRGAVVSGPAAAGVVAKAPVAAAIEGSPPRHMV
jgi:hypothetical protein